MTDRLPASAAARSVAVDVLDPDLDADVRAVLAALALPVRRGDGGAADVLVTDRDGTGPALGTDGVHAAGRVVRVVADGAAGADDEAVPLPSGTARLVAVLAAPVPEGRGRLVVVAGAVGGCGTSVLATALAVRAASRTRALLVESDPRGTGLDLALGLEHAPGARVGDVRSALGGPDPDALWEAVPEVAPGCRVLARGRAVAEAPAGEGDDGATGAALAHRGAGGLVVCDAGALRPGDPLFGRANHIVVVTRADLPGAVAAGGAGVAAGRTAELRERAARGRVSLVVRTHRGDPLHPCDVVDAAGLGPASVLPELGAVRRLAGAGDLGRTLARPGGGPLRRLAALADRILGEVGVGDR